MQFHIKCRKILSVAVLFYYTICPNISSEMLKLWNIKLNSQEVLQNNILHYY